MDNQTSLGSLDTNLAVVDVETTGLSVKDDRVVEMGILLSKNREQERHRFLLNPGIPIPEEVSLIHGFTDAHVKDQPTLAQRWDEIEALLHGKILCGYNCLKFDLPLIANDVARALNRAPPAFPLVLDVFVFVMWHLRGLRSRKLMDVCAHFGIRPKGGAAHRALVDCDMTLRLLWKMQEEELIPKNQEEALSKQATFRDKINEEFSKWSYWIYADRKTEKLCIGAGKHCGQPLGAISTSDLHFLVAKMKLKPNALADLRAELERRGEQMASQIAFPFDDEEL
jgi:DNA polymerase III epsilon subunit-like protein